MICDCRAYDPVHNHHTAAEHTDCGGLSAATPCGGCDSCISAQVAYYERRAVLSRIEKDHLHQETT